MRDDFADLLPSSFVHVLEYALCIDDLPPIIVPPPELKSLVPDRPAQRTQAQVAKSILRMIERRKRRIIMTPLGYLGWLTYRTSPRLVERVILRSQAHQSRIFKKFS